MEKKNYNSLEELKKYISFAQKQMEYIMSDYECENDPTIYDNITESSKMPAEKSNLYTEFNLNEMEIMELKSIIQKAAAFTRAADKPMSTGKPIMIFDEIGKSETTEAQMFTRNSHMEEVANISEYIAKGLGHNPDLAYLIGLVHDIGHTWSGHSGERTLTSIANLHDCGYIVHNAMTAYILEREKILENAEASIEQLFPDADLNEIRKLERYMIDGAVCHNGEGTDGKINPAFDKTDKQMQDEIRKCFTQKNADKKIMPATIEGAIIRYADIIAYTRSDIINAFRMKKSDENGGKVFTDFDDDYLGVIGTLLAKEMGNDEFLNFETNLLRKIYLQKKELQNLNEQKEKENSGFTEQEVTEKIDKATERLEKLTNKYSEFEKIKVKYAELYMNLLRRKDPKQVKERVPQMMQNTFKKDLIEYSKGKPYITMSPLIRTMFFKLRALNLEKIVPKSRRKYEIEKLAPAVNKLADEFAKTLIKSGKSYETIPREFQENIKPKATKEERKEFTSNLNRSKEKAFDRKLIHYYDGLKNSNLLTEIYENAKTSIKNITIEDYKIAIGETKEKNGKREIMKYEGDFKEEYLKNKINPIQEKIREYKNSNGLEELTEEHKKTIINQIVEEKEKDIETIVAYKMALEYIGGMTDTTITKLLLSRGFITMEDLKENQRMDIRNSKAAEKGNVKKLGDAFNNYDEMIIE